MNGDLSQGGDGVISGAVVEGNVIYDNGRAGGSGINGDGVQSSRIANNLLYDNHASGISLYRIDGGAAARGTTSSSTTRSCRPPTAAGPSTSRTAAPATRGCNNILLTRTPSAAASTSRPTA